MFNKFRFLFALFLVIISVSLFALSAEQIIDRVDENATFSSAYSEGSITTVDRFGEKRSSFQAWSKGTSNSLIEFTSIAERGQKILRTGASLYLYYPDADQVIRLQGAALRQSVLGSDLSYEDMTKDQSTLDAYTATLRGEEVVDGASCWIIELVAKSRSSAYPKQTLWIDQEHFFVRKATYATASGRALKEMEVIELMQVDGITLAKESRIVDLLKRGSATVMRIETLEVNTPLSDSLFTLENLLW